MTGIYLLSAVPADTADTSADNVDGEPKKSGMTVVLQTILTVS